MENAITKATDYVTFGFSFRILAILSLPGKFQRHFRWAIRVFQCFSSHPPKKFQQTTLVSSTWTSGVKGEWRAAADWWYQAHVKKVIFKKKKYIYMLAYRVVCCSHQSDRLGYVSRTNQITALRYTSRTNHAERRFCSLVLEVFKFQRIKRVSNRFFGIRNGAYLKAGIREFK